MRRILFAFLFVFLFCFSGVVASEELSNSELENFEEMTFSEFNNQKSSGDFSSSSHGKKTDEEYAEYLKKISKKFKRTIVYGTTFEKSTDEIVPHVNVNVTCYTKDGPISKSTTSNGNGEYMVKFKRWKGEECNIGDEVLIQAEKGEFFGVYEAVIDEYNLCKKTLRKLVDIPLVPEFGVIVGMLTLISAVGIFFVVRRE